MKKPWKENKDERLRNPLVAAMIARYGKTRKVHGSRNDRRPDDARRSWRNESW